MADDADRARRVSAAILDGLATPGASAHFKVTKRDACTGCPSSACAVCGAVLPGAVYIVTHAERGKRHLSDKAVHYMGHGLVHYETGYIYRGEPVTVDLDLAELEGYLDLA
jgi:hypothetical protein